MSYSLKTKRAYNASGEIEDSVLTVSEGEIARLDTLVNRRNLLLAWGVMMLVLCIFLGRVFFLAVIQGERYKNIADGNSIRSVAVSAPRGQIFDRHGNALVYNVPSTNVVIDSFTFPEDTERQAPIANILERVLDMSQDDIFIAFQELNKNTQERVTLKRAISQDQMLKLIELERKLPGILLEGSVKRQYEESAIFAHVIGYEGKVSATDLEKHPDYLFTDSVGRQGIEKTYESHLRGVHGQKRFEVDALGHVRRTIAEKDPIKGSDITLTLDGDLQKVIYDSMVAELSAAGLEKGAAVALNPQTGEILALVSIPSYDNNIFSTGDGIGYADLINDPAQPLFNRAIAGEYPPASTIKPLIAAAALEENIISASKQIEGTGGIQIGRAFFGDWNVHGFTDIRRAIAVSSDTYFYAVGGGYRDVRGMGMETMKEYEMLFGLGSPSNIQLPGEVSGFVPDPEWKQEVYGERWYVGDTYNASIGQGYMSATVLQMAMATATIANGGTLWAPRLVSHFTTPDGDVIPESSRVRHSDFVSDDSLKVVQEGMRMTVTDGTALMLNTLTVPIAGKTGTAQYGPKETTHGWFTSFAPYDHPIIAMAVLVEAQDAEEGYHAVPITDAIYRSYFGLEPQELKEKVVDVDEEIKNLESQTEQNDRQSEENEDPPTENE